MKIPAAPLAAASLVLAAVGTARAQPAHDLHPTVFGAGPELHLRGANTLHTTGIVQVNRTATAVGLGFHPGASVHLIWAPVTASLSRYVRTPIASAIVDPRAQFTVSFRVRPAFAGGQPFRTITVEAYEGRAPGAGAIAVAPLVVYR